MVECNLKCGWGNERNFLGMGEVRHNALYESTSHRPHGKEDDAAIVKVIEKIAGFEVKRLKK